MVLILVLSCFLLVFKSRNKGEFHDDDWLAVIVKC